MNGTPDLARARWPWLVLLALLLGGLTVAAVDGGGPASPSERARAIATTMKCPVCAGQSVADSDAPAARNIRTEINRRVAAGETDDEIRRYFTSRYGDQILLTPEGSGVSGLVWFLPVAGAVAAGAGLAGAFRRWRADAVEVAAVDDDDRVLVAQAMQADRDALPGPDAPPGS